MSMYFMNITTDKILASYETYLTFIYSMHINLALGQALFFRLRFCYITIGYSSR